jgi:endonuclease/exonuclease/phosphatase family metal-dependent hydrolase
MKRRILLATFLLSPVLFFTTNTVLAQTRLAAWTFDATPVAPNTPTTLSPLANSDPQSGTAFIYANGTNGSSSWVTATTGNEITAFGGSTLNDPRGGSAVAGNTVSLVSSTANGKAIVIKFSMTGYRDPVLTFATRGTSTGFTTHTWAWSTDGSSFTNFGSNTANTTATFTLQTLDLSSINSVDGAAAVYLRLTVTGATSTSGNNRLDNIVLNAISTTPPNFTSTYPKAQNASSTGFQAVVNLDKTGTAYLVVIPDGDPAPSSAQVKAGQDGAGTGLSPDKIAAFSVTTASADFSTNITGLASSTNYDVYFVAENADGIQASPVKVDVSTLAAGDVTPPIFTATYPIVNLTAATGFTVRTNLDEAGQTYFVVLPSGSTAPSSAQVKNGQDGSGASLTTNLKGTINVAAGNTEYTAVVNGLTPVTAYDIYFVAEDNTPNLQATPTMVTATTGTLFTEDFNTCDGTASFSSYSVTGDQVWGCTDFGRASKGMRMNGFGSSAVLNEDWLISPLVTLDANASLSFYSQFSFAGNALQLKISSDYSGSGDPNLATWTTLNGGFPSVAVASTSTSLADWTLSNVDLSAYTGNFYVAFFYTSTASAAARWTIDEINFSNAQATFVQVTPSALLFNASAQVKTYTLKGTNLINNVTITAPSNFEVSKDNIAFSSSINYTAAEANATQTVYVRFTAPGVTAATFINSITNTSSGFISKNVSVKGTDMSQTFDISTWNMEFFGTDVRDASNVEFGPTDDALQVSNATSVMATLGSDIFAVEEISDDNAFNTLVAGLPNYDKVVSDRWSYSFAPPDPNFPPQKVGFVFNTSTVQLISSRVMFAKMYDDIQAGTVTLPNYPTGTSSSFWSSGRLPFMATFDVTINGIKKRIRVIDIHAKSGATASDFDRRKYDVGVLRDSLNAQYANDNVILLGDFNDDVDNSIYTSSPVSSYKVVVDDVDNFNVLTYALSLTGASSFPSSNSMIDHIVISNELTPSYVGNSITIEDPRTYINNYTNTTSDHLPVTARFQLVKTDQTITFAALPAKTVGDAPFNLTATSSSGLAVSYTSSDPTIASISGNTVTILKVGTVDITASQAGDTQFNAASDVVRQLVINKINQTIQFGSLTPVTYGDAPFDLSAITTSSLPPTFVSSDPTIASISGPNNTVTILKAGTVNITASQAGDANFNAAPDVVQPLVINKANQTITFGALSPVSVGASPFNLTATSSSGLAVTYTSSTPGVATVSGNTVTVVGGGSTTITASQVGDGNYNAAVAVPQTLVVNKIDQTITFGPLTPVSFGVSPFNLSATASSGLAITYTSSAPAVATISGNTVTIVGGGSTTITASQAGNASYNAATPVDQVLVVNKINQTITFNALSDKTMGDAPFSLSASSTSALTVAFGTTSDKITISGTQVTIVKPGRATVTASQAGNASYNAATPVDRSFCIKPAKPTITISNSNTASPTLTSSATAGNQWYLNGNIIAGATNATLNVTGPGTYKVQVKIDDCVSDFSNDTAIIVTGDLKTTSSIIAYPNPAESYIEVRGIPGEILNTQLIDMTGRATPMVLEKRDDVHRGNVESLSAGIYLLRIQQESKVHQVKFIKK